MFTFKACSLIVRCAWIVCGLISLGLSGCGTHPILAPVGRDVSTPNTRSQPQTYKIRRGDTLYSIAFRFGLDYRLLAKWNRISAPYVIYAGTRLTLRAPRLRQASQIRPAPKEPDARRASGAARQGGGKPAPEKLVSSPRETANKRSDAARVQSRPKSRPQTRSRPKVKPQANPRVSTPVRVNSSPSKKVARSGKVSWQWPARGTILKGFKKSGNRGVDIGGKAGALVVSAADGKIVYSGNGLIGYGRLVIIKHNERFLTAYAHNEAVLVSEGQTVKRGVPIAKMGSSGTNRVKLHFEIRKDGNPVDPIKYLPKR